MSLVPWWILLAFLAWSTSPEASASRNGTSTLDPGDHRHMEQLPRDATTKDSLWYSTLFAATNGTGRVSHDWPVWHAAVKVLEEYVMGSIRAQRPVGGLVTLDPAWLFPLGPVQFQNRVLKATLSACNLYLHNLKTAKVAHLDIRRDQDLQLLAVGLILDIPIIWMSGSYRLTRGLLFGFIPSGGSGHFNLDIKKVRVGVIVTVKVGGASEEPEVDIKDFDIGIQWEDAAFKFDGLWKGFNKLADLSLNQLGLGEFIARKKKATIVTEVELYIRKLSSCILHDLSDGIDLCMRNWWISRGWTYPWEEPTC